MGAENEKCVIVYDDTEMTKGQKKKDGGFKSDQGKFWWQTSAKLLNPLRFDVDKSFGVQNLEDMCKKLRQYLEKDDRFYWIEFWGHGYEGHFCIGEHEYSADDFINMMTRYGITKERFCTHIKDFNDPIIWFRTCETGIDENFLKKISAHFQVYTHSHTEKVGYNAEWPGMIGCSPTGKIRKGGKSSLTRPVDF